MTAYPPPPAPGPQQPLPPGMPSPRPRSRRAWAWITAGACLIVLLIAAAAVAIGLLIFLSSTPEKTVRDYQRAWDTSHCELFVDTTTEKYRNGATCTDFQQAVAQGVSEHDYEVTSVETDGDRATVVIHETAGSGTSTATATTTFQLVKRDGDWRIDSSLVQGTS